MKTIQLAKWLVFLGFPLISITKSLAFNSRFPEGTRFRAMRQAQGATSIAVTADAVGGSYQPTRLGVYRGLTGYDDLTPDEFLQESSQSKTFPATSSMDEAAAQVEKRIQEEYIVWAENGVHDHSEETYQAFRRKLLSKISQADPAKAETTVGASGSAIEAKTFRAPTSPIYDSEGDKFQQRPGESYIQSLGKNVPWKKESSYMPSSYNLSRQTGSYLETVGSSVTEGTEADKRKIFHDPGQKFLHMRPDYVSLPAERMVSDQAGIMQENRDFVPSFFNPDRQCRCLEPDQSDRQEFIFSARPGALNGFKDLPERLEYPSDQERTEFHRRKTMM